MWRSSTITVGVPYSCGAFAACVASCDSSRVTWDSSSVSSATAVPLFGPPEVPEADDKREHCPEYASRPDPSFWEVPVDKHITHELDVSRGGIELQGPAERRGQARG